MELWGFSLLFLARISVNQAQLRRQRTGELEQPQGGVQELACPVEGGGQQEPAASLARDCPQALLPWALLLALLGTSAVYLLFSREHGGGAAPGPEGETSLEGALLRDVAGVLHVIRPRLWQIAQAHRKQRQQQRPGGESTVGGH